MSDTADADTTFLKETLADGTRRVWFLSGQQYAATAEQRAEIVKGVTEMHWQRPGTDMPMSPGLLLKGLVEQLGIRWVAEWGYSAYPIEHRGCGHKNSPECCHPDCWGSYCVVGIKVRQHRYWWTLYFLDVGIGSVALIGDTIDAKDPPGKISRACAMTWHDQCKGKFRTETTDTWEPCGCTCRHPHIEEEKPVAHLFTPGRVTATNGAMVIDHRKEPAFLSLLLSRHLNGDWGDVDEHDRKANNQALKDGERILSVYGTVGDPDRIYILTEADRSSTTILRPDEY